MTFGEPFSRLAVAIESFSGTRIPLASSVAMAATSASGTAWQDEAILVEFSRAVRLQDVFYTAANMGHDLDAKALQDRFQGLRNGSAEHCFDARTAESIRPPDQIGSGQGQFQLAAANFLVVPQVDHQEVPRLVAHGRYT